MLVAAAAAAHAGRRQDRVGARVRRARPHGHGRGHRCASACCRSSPASPASSSARRIAGPVLALPDVRRGALLCGALALGATGVRRALLDRRGDRRNRASGARALAQPDPRLVGRARRHGGVRAGDAPAAPPAVAGAGCGGSGAGVTAGGARACGLDLRPARRVELRPPVHARRRPAHGGRAAAAAGSDRAWSRPATRSIATPPRRAITVRTCTTPTCSSPPSTVVLALIAFVAILVASLAPDPAQLPARGGRSGTARGPPPRRGRRAGGLYSGRVLRGQLGRHRGPENRALRHRASLLPRLPAPMKRGRIRRVPSRSSSRGGAGARPVAAGRERPSRARLHAAMRYSVFAGGKRVRPGAGRARR